MNIVQTALVFVGIPLAIIALFAAAVYGRAEIHQPNRYRPGRPWTHPPVWYLPHASALDSRAVADRTAIESGEAQPVITAEGGASGEW